MNNNELTSNSTSADLISNMNSLSLQNYNEESNPEQEINFSNINPSHPPTDPKEEINLIWELMIQYKRDWKKIVRRYQNIYNIKTTKEALIEKVSHIPEKRLKGRVFLPEDDERLLEIVKNEKFDWLKISSFFPERCPLSLRNRYYAIVNRKQKVFVKHSDILLSKEYSLDTLVKDIKFKTTPKFLDLIESMQINGNKPLDI